MAIGVSGGGAATVSPTTPDDFKQSVRVATTAAGTLVSSFENGDTIDGIVLVAGNRILIKNQAAGVENGIYTVNASGAPTRANDYTVGISAASTIFIVEEGTANADKAFQCTNDVGGDVVGTDALVFVQFPSGAGMGDFTNGGDTAGADRTMGNNDNFALAIETNALNRLNVKADGDIDIISGSLQMAGTDLIDATRDVTLVDGATIRFGSGINMTIAGSGAQDGLVLTAQDASGDKIKLVADADIELTPAGNVVLPGTATAVGRLHVEPSAAGNVGLSVKGLAAQTGDLQQWLDSAAAVRAFVQPSGNVVAGQDPTGSSNTGAQITADGKVVIRDAGISTTKNVILDMANSGNHMGVSRGLILAGDIRGTASTVGARIGVDTASPHEINLETRDSATRIRDFQAGVDVAVFETSDNADVTFTPRGTGEVFVSGAALSLTDGITAPGTTAGRAKLYVDTADGDLKIKFGDGTVKTIVTDT